MKRFFAWLLAILLFTLSGCTSEMDALMGTWHAQVDIQNVMAQRLERESPELAPMVEPGEFPVTVVLSFYADGTYQASIDPDSVQAACTGYTARVEEGLWQYLLQLHAQQGLDTTLEQYLQSLGITREALMHEVIGQSLADEVLLELGLREEGFFTLEKGKLFLMAELEAQPSDFHRYQVEGEALTLSPGEYEKQSQQKYFEEHLPLLFRKATTQSQ